MIEILRRCPVTITLTGLAIIAFWVPGLSEMMQLDFARLGEGQWYRLWSGHLTHFDSSHLFWDLTVFCILGGITESRVGRRFLPMLIVAAASISLAIAAWCPETDVYRGLSGLDTALYVWFIADQIWDSIASKQRRKAGFWSTLMLGLFAKTVFEWYSGEMVFVAESNFRPLVESHLAGAAMGLVCAGAARWTDPTLARKRLAPANGAGNACSGGKDIRKGRRPASTGAIVLDAV
jgi:rhomboid family GlyGly-CTERM serine protease